VSAPRDDLCRRCRAGVAQTLRCAAAQGGGRHCRHGRRRPDRRERSRARVQGRTRLGRGRCRDRTRGDDIVCPRPQTVADVCRTLRLDFIAETLDLAAGYSHKAASGPTRRRESGRRSAGPRRPLARRRDGNLARNCGRGAVMIPAELIERAREVSIHEVARQRARPKRLSASRRTNGLALVPFAADAIASPSTRKSKSSTVAAAAVPAT
jgi:hypothetical protein